MPVDGRYDRTMAGTKGARPVAEDELTTAWAQLSTLFMEKREMFFEIIRAHGLTPPHGFALTSIIDGPVRMRDLADHMRCDASYITAIVDRFETTGLAQRQADANDRRVKVIVLTAKGRRVAAQLQSALSSPPAALDRLSKADRTALARILGKIVQPGETMALPPRPPRLGVSQP